MHAEAIFRRLDHWPLLLAGHGPVLRSCGLAFPSTVKLTIAGCAWIHVVRGPLLESCGRFPRLQSSSAKTSRLHRGIPKGAAGCGSTGIPRLVMFALLRFADLGCYSRQVRNARQARSFDHSTPAKADGLGALADDNQSSFVSRCLLWANRALIKFVVHFRSAICSASMNRSVLGTGFAFSSVHSLHG